MFLLPIIGIVIYTDLRNADKMTSNGMHDAYPEYGKILFFKTLNNSKVQNYYLHKIFSTP